MFNKPVFFLIALGLSSSAFAVKPPGPNEPGDKIILPTDGKTTYFKFSERVKVALDRDYIESNKLQLGFGRGMDRNELKIAKGGGTYVYFLGDQFYNVHVSYKPRTSDKKGHPDFGAENSGRSFGVGPTARDAKDYTYPQLFRDMQNYAKKHEDMSDFYRAFFRVLVFCDANAIKQLDNEGQNLLSHVLAIYEAELNRARMSWAGKIKKYDDWHVHLGDVTMLAAFHANTGLAWAADKGKLMSGDLDIFIGHGTGGSGVGGKGGIQRREFQTFLTGALRKAGKTKQLDSLMGEKSDVFHSFMNNINKDSIKDGELMIEAMVTLLNEVRKNARSLIKVRAQ